MSKKRIYCRMGQSWEHTLEWKSAVRLIYDDSLRVTAHDLKNSWTDHIRKQILPVTSQQDKSRWEKSASDTDRNS